MSVPLQEKAKLNLCNATRYMFILAKMKQQTEMNPTGVVPGRPLVRFLIRLLYQKLRICKGFLLWKVYETSQLSFNTEGVYSCHQPIFDESFGYVTIK